MSELFTVYLVGRIERSRVFYVGTFIEEKDAKKCLCRDAESLVKRCNSQPPKYGKAEFKGIRRALDITGLLWIGEVETIWQEAAREGMETSKVTVWHIAELKVQGNPLAALGNQAVE